MKNYKNYLGFDVSKNTLDYCLLIPERDTVKRGSVANEKKSLQTLFAAFSKEGLMMEDTLVVFEHTGIYSTILAVFLCGNGWNYAEVPAIEIKRSRGLSRGKSDTIDAQEIAKYAMRNEDKIQLSEVPEIIYRDKKFRAHFGGRGILGKGSLQEREIRQQKDGNVPEIPVENPGTGNKQTRQER